jgi:hypothetical protein
VGNWGLEEKWDDVIFTNREFGLGTSEDERRENEG